MIICFGGTKLDNHIYLMKVISNLITRINSYSGNYSERDDVEIDYIAFFILCDSMKDYVKKSDYIEDALKRKIYNEIHLNEEMKLCNAIANLEKHLAYDRGQDRPDKIKIKQPGIQSHHIINRHLSTEKVLESPISDTNDEGFVDIIESECEPYYEETYDFTISDEAGKIYYVKSLANKCFDYLCKQFENGRNL